jgi:hypothetical protein
LRPRFIVIRPVGSIFMIMLEPSSTAHTLSSGSTRTTWANERPYEFGIHSFTKWRFWSNSNSLAAFPPRELPDQPVRLKTNRWPCEFIDTPSVSPMVSPGMRSGRISSVT